MLIESIEDGFMINEQRVFQELSTRVLLLFIIIVFHDIDSWNILMLESLENIILEYRFDCTTVIINVLLFFLIMHVF